jgi:hypothetical protein
LSKLEFYGIPGKVNVLIKSYLKNGYQTAVTDKKLTLEYLIKLGKNRKWCPTVINSCTFAFLSFSFFYINDLPQLINNKSIPVLFADDTSIIVTHSNPTDFNRDIKIVFECLTEWFNTNLL